MLRKVVTPRITVRLHDYNIPNMHNINVPQLKTACRLQHFINNWKLITSDKWILQTVSGYQIPFLCKPHQWRPRITKVKSQEQSEMFMAIISDLMTKGAIKEVQKQDEQFVSTMFLIHQPTKVRPIFNLKSLNKYVRAEKFKLESLDLVKSIMKKGDYLMKLDLTDAYYTIPISQNHRKFLRFQLQGKMYEYQCLPFGLSSAPRAFTKLMKPVISLLRKAGLRLVLYIDDFLIMHQDLQEIQTIFNLIVQLLTDLGFLIKREKCSPAPTKELTFLGALLNSDKMTISVPQEKMTDLQNRCLNLQKSKVCKSKDLAGTIGLMSHVARIGLWEAPLYYRKTQKQYIASVHLHGTYQKSRDKIIHLNLETLSELKWWTSHELSQHNGIPLNLPPFDLTIATDSSKKGWGAFCNGQKTGGQWEVSESRAHINVLELKAALLALRSFVRTQRKCPVHIELLMDNSTAVAYLNKRGGTKSSTLAQLAVEIWTFCLSHNIWITARHLPGVLNVEADFASRNFNNRTEWTLDRKIFRQVTSLFYTPQVDLFASRITHQLPMYMSRYPDPESLAVDAFSQNWNKWTVFIHPPIVLLPRILQKLRQDNASGILIAPHWPGQPWFPLIIELLTDYPAMIPMTASTITLPFDKEEVHPLWKTLKLAAWPVSGVVSQQQAFLRRCAGSSWHPGEKPHRRDMKDHGKFGLAGVSNGVSVPFQPL